MAHGGEKRQLGFFFFFLKRAKSSGSVLQGMHLTKWEPQSQQDVVPLKGYWHG